MSFLRLHWLGLSLTLLVLAGAARQEARAHTFWPTLYSAKTSLSVEGESLAVLVTVEVPAVSMVAKFRKYFRGVDLTQEIEQGRFEALEEDFRQHQLSELAKGLELRLDGEIVKAKWQPVDTPVNGRANEGFFVYLLELAPLSAPAFNKAGTTGTPLVIEISNQVHQGENILFANYVQAKAGWKLVESSTPQPPAGADLSVGSPDEIAMWSEDPERRQFRVLLERVR